MLVKKVRSLKDCDFKTSTGFKLLFKGQVLTYPFKNKEELDEHIKLGTFELVGEDTEEEKNIEVLYKKNSTIPMENELLSTIELTGNLDKLKEEKTMGKEEPVESEEEENSKEEKTPVEEKEEPRNEDGLLIPSNPNNVTKDTPVEVWNSNEGDLNAAGNRP
jgi:hypothetical protein